MSMKKPTILLVSPHAKVKLLEEPSCGFERRLSFLGKTIVSKYNLLVIEPDNVVEGGKKNEREIVFKSLSFFKIKNMRLGSFFLDLNPFYIWKLIKIVKKHSPKVIIISFPWGIPITCLIIKKFLKINSAIIYNAHNVESEYSKIILKDKEIPWIFKKFYCHYTFFIEKLATNSSDFIFAVSEENRKCFIKKYRCKPDKIFVVPSGSLLPESIPKQNDTFIKNEGELWIVFHGTYMSTHNKGAIDAIRYSIAKKFEKKYKNIKFVIAGKGLPKVENGNVILMGFIRDLFGFLSSCDIAIVPLKEGEGTKLKIFDYMAIGLPIVTTKKGAEGLGLVNGEHAIITDDIDGGFTEAIEFLAKNPEVRKKIGENAKKFFEEKYHPEKIKEEFLYILDEIVKNNCKG